MGCGGSSAAAAAQEPRPQVKSSASLEVKLVPGQPAIIRNCPIARLNGERVICEEYNASLGEWLVKGDRFPLTAGMSLGAQFLEGLPQQTPTLLTGDVPLVTGKNKDLLRTVLEKYNAMFDGTNDRVGEFVNHVYVYAFGIVQEGSGLGASGECPFASAYEVHLFYQFCLNVCVAWSQHDIGNDEQMDKDFYSQISDLCSIMCFLDTNAVPLPEEIETNIKMVQRDALFPHWVDAQTSKGVAALRCCVAVGQKWELQDTKAFQKALEALEKCNGDEIACVQTQSSA